jgi:hypothetical protein
VYKAYKDAKKVVDAAAKRQGVSFKELPEETREPYKVALELWLKTKSGFRRPRGDRDNPADQAEESGNAPPQAESEANADGELLAGTAITAAPQEAPSRKRTRSNRSSSQGKYALPPPYWEPVGGEVWADLSRQRKKRAYRSHSSTSPTALALEN